MGGLDAWFLRKDSIDDEIEMEMGIETVEAMPGARDECFASLV